MTKTKVYLWKRGAQLIAMESKTPKTITPCENAANVLSILPASDVEAMWEHVLRSVKHSVSIGEDDAEMISRMHAEMMAVTTEAKNA